MAPCLIQQLIQHDLADAAGVLCADFVVADETLDDLCGGSDPAGSGSRRDDLGE